MDLRLAHVVLAPALFAGVFACGGSQRTDGGSTKEFAAEFYADENLANYIATVDALLLEADRRRFSGLSDLQSGKPPEVHTANGVHLVMTVTDLEGGSAHHVSFSRPPYLATPFARFFAGLVAKRGGYPVPDAIMVSKNGVYHVEWRVPREARERLTEVRAKAQQETDPMKVAADVTVSVATMRIDKLALP